MTELPPRARFLVFCDGTETPEGPENSSNIMRLSIAIGNHDNLPDEIRKVIYYSSGKSNKVPMYSEVTTGVPLADHVLEVYYFLSCSYLPGDEIYLFGFSSGACTARTVCNLIGEIGILEPRDVHHFPEIFITYQKLWKTNNERKRQRLIKKLSLWTSPNASGKERMNSYRNMAFSVTCLGLFETVGSLGLPEEDSICSKKDRKLLGFSDRTLGEHVQCAFQAFALHESRPTFNCNKLEQTEGGKRKGQVLKQCWFSGNHLDIGGGYPEHDLADLPLIWMVANLSEMLPVNLDYLSGKIKPVAPWGKHKSHQSESHEESVNTNKIMSMIKLTTGQKQALRQRREFPAGINRITGETIHPSVLQQSSLHLELVNAINLNPSLIEPLLPFEIEMKLRWPDLQTRTLTKDPIYNILSQQDKQWDV
ncbi:hypothetical protein BDQ17DRAFT_1345811 [Cyathus striatus]|nr:hypothetical protein BDQ17DRAFT_1345811 [Cyathus striatus]